MTSVEEMTAKISADKERNGYTRKLYNGRNYKEISDAHKGEQLTADITERISKLRSSRDKVNFSDLQDVRQRTFSYLEACAAAQAYPSVLGLSAIAYGVSRQALNQWLQRNPGTPTALFIEQIKDVFADILVNASLKNLANPISTIFQLKNCHAFSDRVELQAIPAADDTQAVNMEDMLKRYDYAIAADDIANAENL